MTEGSSTEPDGYHLDNDAWIAAVEVIGRAGAKGFQVDCLEPDASIAQARWWAAAMFRGIRVHVENHVGPVEAAEALVHRVMHGAQCRGCLKRVAIDDSPVPIGTLLDGTPPDEAEARRLGVCMWERVGRRWERGCGPDAPEGSTREKLARAMAEAGVPTHGIRQARAGYYDDYLSELPFPCMTLVNDLEHNGFRELAERARQGEFDGTKEESDAWARSEEGQSAFADLLAGAFNDAAKGGGKATAVKEAAAKAAGEGPARQSWRANRKRAGKKRRKK